MCDGGLLTFWAAVWSFCPTQAIENQTQKCPLNLSQSIFVCLFRLLNQPLKSKLSQKRALPEKKPVRNDGVIEG